MSVCGCRTRVSSSSDASHTAGAHISSQYFGFNADPKLSQLFVVIHPNMWDPFVPVALRVNHNRKGLVPCCGVFIISALFNVTSGNAVSHQSGGVIVVQLCLIVSFYLP